MSLTDSGHALRSDLTASTKPPLKSEKEHVLFHTMRRRPHYAEKFENVAEFLRSGLPSTLIRHENGAFRKRSSNRRNLKTPFYCKIEVLRIQRRENNTNSIKETKSFGATSKFLYCTGNISDAEKLVLFSDTVSVRN